MKHFIIQATQDSPSTDGSRDIRYYTGANGEYAFVTSKPQAQQFDEQGTARDAVRNYRLHIPGYVVTVVPVFEGQS